MTVHEPVKVELEKKFICGQKTLFIILLRNEAEICKGFPYGFL